MDLIRFLLRQSPPKENLPKRLPRDSNKIHHRHLGSPYTHFCNSLSDHIKQLNEKLRPSVKWSQSIIDYMCSFKMTADILASIGSLVDSEDLTDYVLYGLDETYEPVIDGVYVRDTHNL